MGLVVAGADAEVSSFPVRLPGSKTQSLDVTPSSGTIRDVYTQHLEIVTESHAAAQDRESASIGFAKLVMPYLHELASGFAGNKVHLGDTSIDPSNSSAQLLNLQRRPGPGRTQQIEVRLDEGFLSLPGRSTRGFQIEVGLGTLNLHTGGVEWSPVQREALAGPGDRSPPMTFPIPLENAADFERGGGRVEIRLYDPHGLPVTRLLCPVNHQLRWAADAFD
jgi:hypothetical protein